MIKTPLSTVIGGAFWTPSATIIGSSSQNLTQLIKSIFSAGEQGFAYDPNDLTTMYQDAEGTIQVTAAGQPVGLMKDKSGRNNHAYQSASASRPILQQIPILGVNVLPNLDLTTWGKIAAGTTATTNSFNIVDGAGGINLNNVFEVGKTYKVKVKFTTTATSLTLVNASYGVTPTIASSSSGIVDTIYTATNSPLYLRTGNGVTAVSELEVKEVTGYRTDQNYIKYDGVDDKLITNLPAQLTGCTVVRSVPNVGTQILTNQTMPTPYNDNTDHCGLIVINRALTASETSQITKLFNKAAGV